MFLLFSLVLGACACGRTTGSFGQGRGTSDDDSQVGDDDSQVSDDDTSANDDDTSSSGDDDTSSSGDDDTAGNDPCAGVEQTAGTSVSLEVVVSGLSSPVFVTHAGDDTERLFVVEQGGRVRIAGASPGAWSEWLDLRSQVSAGGERGLLSLAFHPQFATNGQFYVYYTDNSGDVVVSRFLVAGDPKSDLPDVASEQVILE